MTMHLAAITAQRPGEDPASGMLISAKKEEYVEGTHVMLGN